MSMTTLTPARSGVWQADPGSGVYVHVPFCLHRCHYCDFNTYEGLDALHEPYVDALITHISRSEPAPAPVRSVFFGGGTPTLLPAGQLGRVLAAIRSHAGIAPDAEITVEANPETVDESYFTALLEAGFNRVSLGVQSLRPSVLEALGRTHSADRALSALDDARRAGFTSVNADLIYGSPWESDDDWLATLEGVVDAAPDHVSAYALTIEEGTPLATFVDTGRTPDVDPDVQADRHAVASRVLGAAGYERYETSNWAKSGQASVHNVMYWSAGDYLAFGAGAHGHDDGRRYWNVRLPRDYISDVEAGGTAEAGYEVIAPADRAGEAVMLGLRLTSGVNIAELEARFESPHLTSRAPVIDELVSQGWLELRDGWLRLSERATMVANDVIARLV